MNRGICIVSVFALAGVAGVGASAGAQSIISLGTLPDGTTSAAGDVSADGTVVVGTANSGSSDRAFRWTAATGMQNLGLLPGGSWSQGFGVSPNGSVVVGYAGTPAGPRGYRWTSGGGMSDLGVLPTGTLAAAHDVSAEQSAVVGYVEMPGVLRAYRWTSGTGMVDLGALRRATDTRAYAVSDDGGTVVGASDGVPFIWTPTDGLREIPHPDGQWSGDGIASAINADGTAICGAVNWQSFLWTPESGTRFLTPPPGKTQSRAHAISGDGQTIGGSAYTSFGNRSAFIWRESTGMVELETYLESIGVMAWGWDLSFVSGISADGRTMVGGGRYLGQDRAFLITGLPRACRVDMNGDGTLDIFDFLEFQNAFDAGSDRADINGDGVLDIFDFLAFQNMFDAGCP